MKLYKQLITDEQTISDPVFINDYKTIEGAKREAERMAKEDNCKDIAWVSSKNNISGENEQPHELFVTKEYKFVVRDW